MAQTEHGFEPIDFKTRLPALDGIRALAVTMVFALHYGGGTHGGRLLGLLNAVRLRGWMGVDLFFVLSGFLITGILYDTRDDCRYFLRFFARRCLRILPVFYLVFVVILLLTPLLQYQWRTGHLWFLLYLGNFALGFDPTLRSIASANHVFAAAHLEHLWSLCVEEQFYLIWPLIVWSVRDRVRLLWTAGGLSLAALVLRILFVRHVPIGLPIPWDFDQVVMLHMLPYRMDALLMGGMLALLLRGPSAKRWQRACKWLFLCGTIAVIAICTLSPAPDSGWLLTVGLTAIATASAGLIGSALRPNSLAFRLFRLRPLRVLGRCSYGFYVYHVLWAGGWSSLVAYLTPRLHSSVLSNAISVAGAFAVTLAVSLLSYNLFEARFLQLKRYFIYDSEKTAMHSALAQAVE
jgi:peptidoglycan/LPS O-acetylase OafA/YrhL